MSNPVVNERVESTKAEQETLYLIYKYLTTQTPCRGTCATLKNELQDYLLLGNVYSWDGSYQKAKINDMDRKYSSLPDDTLLTLLSSKIGSKKPTAHSSIINTGSDMSLDPTVDDLEEYHDLVKQLSALTVDQSNQRSDILKTEAKLNKLKELIELHKNNENENENENSSSNRNRLELGIDTSAYLNNLTAKDYEQIQANHPSLSEAPNATKVT
jgi:hypothetical protein